MDVTSLAQGALGFGVVALGIMVCPQFAYIAGFRGADVLRAVVRFPVMAAAIFASHWALDKVMMPVNDKKANDETKA